MQNGRPFQHRHGPARQPSRTSPEPAARVGGRPSSPSARRNTNGRHSEASRGNDSERVRRPPLDVVRRGLGCMTPLLPSQARPRKLQELRAAERFEHVVCLAVARTAWNTPRTRWLSEQPACCGALTKASMPSFHSRRVARRCGRDWACDATGEWCKRTFERRRAQRLSTQPTAARGDTQACTCMV